MKSVFWFVNGDDPNDFFQRDDMQVSDDWCMFSTKLAAYKHAYKILVVEDPYDNFECCDEDNCDDWKCDCYKCVKDELNKDSTEKEYEKFFKKYDLCQNPRERESIIEIPLWG